MAEMKRNRGTANKVEAKSETHPNFKGRLNVEGNMYWLSVWVNEADDGPWLSLAVNPIEGSNGQGGQFRAESPAPATTSSALV